MTQDFTTKIMTQKDKELLLQDLCARLPYGVKYKDRIEGGIHILSLNIIHHYERFIPYLRPMSSMTEEEEEEYNNIDNRAYSCPKDYAHIPAKDRIDWLLKNHFDYRGLIEKGFALEAPEGMYD